MIAFVDSYLASYILPWWTIDHLAKSLKGYNKNNEVHEIKKLKDEGEERFVTRKKFRHTVMCYSN